jgi:hypothetical protein
MERLFAPITFTIRSEPKYYVHGATPRGKINSERGIMGEIIFTAAGLGKIFRKCTEKVRYNEETGNK